VDKETGRVEAFSDGIFAFAITLLVLELRVPHGLSDGAALCKALLDEWPSYFGYLTSFVTIGIMWMNHHRMFNLIHKSDDGLMLVNLVFLLGIAFVPFPTSVVADYLDTSAARVAAAFYSGTYVVIAILFNLLWRYASRGGRLFDKHADLAQAQAITRAYSVGPLLYLGSLAMAYWSPKMSVGMTFAYAVFWALPSRDPFVTSRA
jgi:uncharacterized membrane protein